MWNVFMIGIYYTNKDKGIFLSFYFFWSNIMTYIKCFLWQYSICHQIWTCPIKHCVGIFWTIQNMSILLLLTTRWPIMIHQSNLRLNNPKKDEFLLMCLWPCNKLMYLCLCIAHTYQGCFVKFLFQASQLLFQFTKQFQIFVLKVFKTYIKIII